MIIDQNTPGIEKKDYGYVFRGNLEADSLYIKVNLFVTGWIKAEGQIRALESIEPPASI